MTEVSGADKLCLRFSYHSETSSERRVALAEQAVPAPGEARPDWRIFAAVGAALGAPQAFAWSSAAEVFAEHVGLTAGRDLDMTALSHEMLRASAKA